MVQGKQKYERIEIFQISFPRSRSRARACCLPALFASHAYDMLLRLSSAPKLRGLGVDGGAGSAATRRDKRSVLVLEQSSACRSTGCLGTYAGQGCVA
jgi:hypothetical protein